MQYFGYNRVATIFSGCLLKLIGTFPMCGCQMHQQLGFFLPVLGQRLLCAHKHLFGLPVVYARNFEELFG